MLYLNTQGLDAFEISTLSQTRLTLTEPNRSRSDRDGGEGEQSDRKSNCIMSHFVEKSGEKSLAN